MRHLLATWRIWRLLVHVVWGALQILLDFPRRDQANRNRRVQLWAAKALVYLGVELQVIGTRPAG